MPRKLRGAKIPRGLDDYKLAELFSLERPLIPTEGYCRSEDGRYVADDSAIRAAWQRLSAALVLLWINGWAPTSARFLAPHVREPGVPGTRPAGWWCHCAPTPRRRRESEIAYLRRHGLLLPGEEELIERHARRTAMVRGLMEV
jgi:hypothetical protein